MDMSSVTQMLQGANVNVNGNVNININNNPSNNASSAIPGAPEAPPATPVTIPGQIETYEPSGQTTFTPDRAEVQRLWNRHQERVDSFRQMIETLLNQQADRQNTAWNPFIEVTPEMRAEAEAMIAEGGYFSVEETAARMLQFAVALTGGDPARAESMRDAVLAGFREAERMWGGNLPQISHDTLEATMAGFDEWVAAGDASAISLLNR